jgi:1,4-alpha-glucan branching enzyme
MKVTTNERVEVGGMGSIAHEKGVFFRVWAPNAKSVSVVGDFNEWKDGTNVLEHEENG